jgi:hypothetical protein
MQASDRRLLRHVRPAPADRLEAGLAGAGQIVDYAEVPEGHSAVTFMNHEPVVLVSLFGPSGHGSAGTTWRGPQGRDAAKSDIASDPPTPARRAKGPRS